MKGKKRIFALVDCNNFYASCEKAFRPELKDKPVVILSNNDGCIISLSQEAKQMNLKMTGAYYKVKKEIDRLGVTVFSSNYTLYGDLSDRIMDTLRELGLMVEEYSIDEAFVELTHIAPEDLDVFGHLIKDTIYKWVGIMVKVGIGESKTQAKIASKLAKKQGGVCVLAYRDDIDEVLGNFPVGDIWGVGRRNNSKLEKAGIYTAKDLKYTSDDWARRVLSVVGLRLVEELRGIPCHELEESAERGQPEEKKHIMVSRSFGVYIYNDPEQMQEAVSYYTHRASEKLRKQNSIAGSVYVFIRTNESNKSAPQYKSGVVVNLPEATDDTALLVKHALHALNHIYRDGYTFKKAGVLLGGIRPKDSVQANLFGTYTGNKEQKSKLMSTMDELNAKLGEGALYFAQESAREQRVWKMKSEMRSPKYSTTWKDMLVIDMDKEIGKYQSSANSSRSFLDKLATTSSYE